MNGIHELYEETKSYIAATPYTPYTPNITLIPIPPPSAADTNPQAQ